MTIELREQYTFVTPGFHMDNKHWNAITLLKMYPLNLFLIGWIIDINV